MRALPQRVGVAWRRRWPRRSRPARMGGSDMRKRIAATVRAADAITGAGLEAQLRGRPEVDVVDGDVPPDVVVVAADEVDEPTLQTVRVARRSGVAGVVLVVGRLDDGGLLTAVESGATGVL